MEGHTTEEVNHRSHVTAAALTDELSSSLVRRTSRVFELMKWAVVLSVLLVTVHSLVVTIVIVDGPSMEPTFHTGDVVLVDRLSRLERGDVIVLNYPGDPQHQRYIKRIVALPGETIGVANHQVVVNGVAIAEPYVPRTQTTDPAIAPLTLKPTEYFTLGDNRPVSNDSRYFGPVDARYIVGKVVMTIFAARQ